MVNASRTCRLCIGCVSGLLWIGSGFAHAQPASPDSADEALTQVFIRGLRAYQAERYGEALHQFERAAQVEPSYVTADEGSILYWLGRTYEQVGDGAKARATWWTGLRLLDAAGLFEADMADAYVRSVYRHEEADAYARAASVYLALLAHGDRTSDAAPAHRHVAQMRFLLPTTLSEPASSDTAYGPALSAWWRSQDPLPATLRNERLEEHLARVAYAEAHFGDDSRPVGFDDRGVIYVRLGKPYRERDLLVKDPALIRRLARLGVRETASNVPASTAWFYRDLDYYAYYLFAADRDGHYHLAETVDLVPPSLRNDLTRTQRGRARGEAAVRLMRQLYYELSLFHPDFAGRYTEVDGYAGMMDEAELSSQATAFMSRALEKARPQSGQAREDAGGEFGRGAGRGARSVPEGTTLESLSLRQPHEFAATALLKAREADHAATYRREQVVPRQHTEVLDEMAPLPVAVRAARFLDEDGTTRTEVYWSPMPGALSTSTSEQQSVGAFLLHLTAAQQTTDYRSRLLSRDRYVLRDLPRTEDVTLPAQTVTLLGDTATYHVGLQWDLYRLGTAISEADAQPEDPPVKTGTFHLDTPHRPPRRRGRPRDERPRTRGGPRGRGPPHGDLYRQRPYPFRRVSEDAQLGLYFEAYHLACDAEGQTRYTVEYEVNRERKRGLVRRLFGGRDAEPTGARTTHTGEARTAKEFILLDLSEWEEGGALEITVRVTDEATGAEVARSISFDLAP